MTGTECKTKMQKHITLVMSTILWVMHGAIEYTKHGKTKTKEWQTVKQDAQEPHKLIMQIISKNSETQLICTYGHVHLKRYYAWVFTFFCFL